MSFREKSAWVAIAAILIVYTWYFSQVALGVTAGRIPEDYFATLLAVCVGVIVAVQLISRVLMQRASRGEPLAPGDERELMAELRATRVAFNALSLGVGAAICFAVGVATLVRRGRLPWDEGGVLVLNALLLAFVISELCRYASHIAYLRRTA